jgi:hypothetical protein|tara:strand:+ start:121 stop:1269 length:1149 start_codon:yes stop_codon:yes gene_type:complete
MGSTTKKSKVSSSTRGMSPGQSMAMAGNTGLAGVKEKDAVTIQNAIRNINRATGDNQGSSFKDIGQNIGEVGSKYRRPADVENYAKKLSLINNALNQGAGVFETPDGIRRVNFNKTGIKNDQGQTILSMQLPNLNATAPSLGQLGGDMSRALTGYNSLQYTNPSSNIPEMVNTEGLGRFLVPGAVAADIAKNLYGTAKNFLFPIEEEEEDIFSSGADATGGAFALAQSLVPRDITIDERVSTPVSEKENTVSVDPFSSGADAVDIGRNTLDGTRLDQVTEPIQQLPEFLTGSKGSDKPKILQIPNQSGGGEGENENQQSQDSPPNTDPSALELSIRRNLESAGFTSSQIDSILGDLGYQMGGLVPPERGPMSSGVASLFKNK